MFRFLQDSFSFGARENELPNRWSSTLEKKLQQLLNLLRAMRGGKTEAKLAIQNLNEVLPWLQIDGFDLRNTDSSFNVARSLLMDLWQNLLSNFDVVPIYEFPSFAKAVLAIARRSEFDVSHLALDVNNRPQCSQADLVQAHRYRQLLYTTQCYVATKLVDKHLLTAMSIESRDGPTLQRCGELGIDLSVFDERNPTREETNQFPSIFQWHRYHTAMLAWKQDSEDERLKQLKDWPAALVVRESMFQSFLKEYIEVVQSKNSDAQLPWVAVPSYGTLIKLFVGQLMRSTMGHTRTLVDASKAVLLTRPQIISLYLKVTMSRTSVYELTSVTETLGSVESWLKELQENKIALPQTFDCEYFGQALDIIVEAAHHQILSRFLGILYAYSDIFTGELRRRFFGEHLLKKHFFSLFLYWDYNVRNIFHQLIIYKIVRVKRSRLQAEGFAIGELGSDQAKHSRPVSHTQLRWMTQTIPLLFAKIESYVKMVAEQLHAKIVYYPRELEVYVPQALCEYKTYLAKYYQWEAEGGEQPLKPVPLKVFASKWDIALLNDSAKKSALEG